MINNSGQQYDDMKKKCIKCEDNKLLSDFPKKKTMKDGHENLCKNCQKEYRKQYYENNKEKELKRNKKYYQDNREYFLWQQKQYASEHKKEKKERSKQYYINNKEKIDLKNKQYYKNNEEHLKDYQKQYRENNLEKVKESVKKSAKKWRNNNPDYSNKYKKERRKIDPLFKLQELMRNMLRRTLNLIGTKKEGKTNDNLGYSPEKLKLRLEINFTDGMSHNVYGEWHVDHTIPVDHFLKKGITDPKIINALCNLKPRWKTNRTINGIFCLGNIEKHNKLILK